MSSPSIFDLIANALFGWRRYRVVFHYKSPDGRDFFKYSTTIGVRFPEALKHTRDMKRQLGPVWQLDPSIRRFLCNGTIDVEPQCYLGRWHERASRGRGED